jgi:ribonuclease P protein subunit POP4
MPPPLLQNPPPTKSTSGTNITHTLLSHAHSPTSAARIYSEKIKSRPLHLKPSTTEPGYNGSSSSSRDARHARRVARLNKLSARRKKLKPRPLSAREKRALGVYDIPKAEQKWCIYEPLHGLWRGYVAEVIALGDGRSSFIGGSGGNATGALAKLASADFHGALLEVVRSRCVSRVGLRGIVVRDSKFAFVLITKRDEVKVVPKEHTMFRFEVPLPSSTELLGMSGKKGGAGEVVASTKEKNLVFELHGDQFQYRATDRANKKFKAHFLPDL